MSSALPEVAFYYPNPMWRHGDWVKSLILYFDGVALLVPEYMQDHPRLLDPAIVAGLEENGLLTILEPETVVDQAATEQLVTALTDILVSGALDQLASEDTAFAELSYSRLGGVGDEGLARMMYEELQKRGLAEPTRDGVSIPMHPIVRSLVLALLAQILAPAGPRHGLELYPATDQPVVQSALLELLGLPEMPSAGRVVSFDLEQVGVDLGAVPLDEILDFRTQHGMDYRRYARDVRRFVRELSALPEEERQRAMQDRREALADTAEALRDRGRKAWQRPLAYFGLAGAGATWTATTGDPIGGVLGLGANALGSPGSASGETGAFSYLFEAGERFRR